jgi:MFS family permease
MSTMRSWVKQHRILLWLCVLIAFNQIGFGSVVPVLPLYASSFGVSPAAIGLTIAVYGLARFLLAVPAGRSSDRLGRRATLAIGGAATVLGNLACAVAPSYELFLAARFLAGAGAALTLTATQIVLADITAPAERGRAMGLYAGVFAFAVGAGPFPGGVLAERFGLQAPFLAYAAMGVVVGVLAWLRVPETGRTRQPSVTTGSLPSFAQQVRLLGANRAFLLISLVSFAAAVARTGALFNVVPLLVRDRLGLAPDQIGLGLSLVSLGALVLAYPSGVLVDRVGRKSVIAPATFVSAIAAVLFAFAPSYAWYLVACSVWSIALGVSSAAPAAYAADTAPTGMNAAAMSTYRMLSDAGYVIGPLILGVVSDLAGAPSALALAAALLGISALLFGRLAPETRYARGDGASP